MLDRSLLKDIGFQRGTTGWDHEVWVYDGMFWIHYGDYDKERWLISPANVDGISLTRKHLFTLLIEAIRCEVHDSMMELSEDW